MLTIGLIVLLATLVWQLVHQFRAKQQPTLDFVLIYAIGVVLLIVGNIFLSQAKHAGLGLSSFAGSGACLVSLFRKGFSFPPGGGFAA
jgi:low temperature requirement protein LtrA